MFRLYGSLGSASLLPHIVLEEVGAKYTFVPVDISGDARDPAYLKLNPHGRVPTLDHDGRVIFETAAIALYLADLHPKAGLAPAIDSPARATYLQWMVYLTNTWQEIMLNVFYSDRYTTDPKDAPRIKAKAAQRLDVAMGVVEAHLAQSAFLAGGSCTTPDLFLYMLAGWQPAELKPISAYKGIARVQAAVGQRPAVQRTVKLNQAA